MSDLLFRKTTIDNEQYWIATGEHGAVSWSILPKGTFGPVALHAENPMWDGHSSIEGCQVVGRPCYADAGYLGGDKLGRKWSEAGHNDDVIWAELTDWYNERFRDSTFVPVDLKAAMDGGACPASLRDHEYRNVLVAIIGGETVYDAIRNAYRSRREAFIRVAGSDPFFAKSRTSAWRQLCDVYANHLDDIENAYCKLDQLYAELCHDDQAAVKATLDYLTGVRA